MLKKIPVWFHRRFLPGCLALLAGAIFFCTEPPHQKVAYVADHRHLLGDNTCSMLLVNIANVKAEYVDNTTPEPLVEYNESFLLQAANSLAMYELSKRYRIRRFDHGTLVTGTSKVISATDSSRAVPVSASVTGDSASRVPSPETFTLNKLRWSVIDGDSGKPGAIVDSIRQLARRAGVQVVAVPYSCFVKNKAVRPSGWRNDKYETYNRPIDYSAYAEFHLQFWDSTGQLLYERVGKGLVHQPILYSLFKHKIRSGENVAAYAHRMYASPIVRAINESIVDALWVR